MSTWPGVTLVPCVMSSATLQACSPLTRGTDAVPGSQVQTVLSKKPEVADFSKGADALGTSREELEAS